MKRITFFSVSAELLLHLHWSSAQSGSRISSWYQSSSWKSTHRYQIPRVLAASKIENEEIDASAATVRGGPILINQHHPLFLQPYDTPGSSLILVKLTGPENYILWSITMCVSLLEKSKIGFVDGRYPKEKFDITLHELWEKCKTIVLSRIMNSIATFTQGISSVSTYFSKLKELWAEFDALMPYHGCGCEESKKAYSMIISEESRRSMCQTSQSTEVTETKKKFDSGNAVHHVQDASNDIGNSQAATATNFQVLYSGLVKGIGREDDGLYMFYSGDFNTTGLQVPSTIPKSVVPKPATYYSGSEFLNSQVVELLRSKGIIDQTSCIYTLKQNGVVKRRHKYILDVARSLRFQAVVPLRFWGESITIAMYIINRLPSAPFEVLLCHAPFLGHMTMFGCLGYVTESQLIPSTPSLSSPSGEFSLHNTAVSLLAEPSLPLSSPLPSPKAPLTRRSNRNSRPPIWIKDYVTHDKGKAHCCYPISTYVSYDNVSSSFGIALTAYSSIIEPKTFSKGVKDPKWVAAMKDEILAL
ncbi:uncharacterized protein LOC142164737 [Nicotiana tabacum]|uniref:Uncharacterized protein LOC142164737 n=1 Tax=Nicotiana tabacum TaxID=4097 RepID=A0AC58S2V6_TOBAC